MFATNQNDRFEIVNCYGVFTRCKSGIAYHEVKRHLYDQRGLSLGGNAESRYQGKGAEYLQNTENASRHWIFSSWN